MSHNYEAVIGLEVHAQLKTNTKIFCRCRNEFGAKPNQHTCPVCLGYPGALPVLNRKAVEFAILMGLATDCQIATFARFARKNYHYPDLPKGYQISQYKEPLCCNGTVYIELGSKKKPIGITRIHLEEDAGKLIHDMPESAGSLIDFNRGGVPLIEIVSEPDIRSPEEAFVYLTALKQILEYLQISDCNMEEGSLRCDANISVRCTGSAKFGIRTEMKNMNSFRNVQHALEFEIRRQSDLLNRGVTVEQQTLLWDAAKGVAIPMRQKEESEDYRYFPDPDLVPVEIKDSWLKKLRNKLPELPGPRRERFKSEYHLRSYDAELLTSDRSLADYFEAIAHKTGDAQLSSKWIQILILHTLKDKNLTIGQLPVTPERFGELLAMLQNKTITPKIAKKIFYRMLQVTDSSRDIVEKEGWQQVSDTSQLTQVVEHILQSHEDEIQRYRTGEQRLFGFFMGQIMQKTRGKANPQKVKAILKQKLDK